ncbi:hypothetical protein E2C01_076357 [Portunus trituberculatus]|uniref:Uncharacterized protein n=1 Tax=Portunus trituberculatus TaxID=210409 RepID=A0A5B7IIC2_PORTR|nr:hypothetical protein [Portunus trituberculatus]
MNKTQDTEGVCCESQSRCCKRARHADQRPCIEGTVAEIIWLPSGAGLPRATAVLGQPDRVCRQSKCPTGH